MSKKQTDNNRKKEVRDDIQEKLYKKLSPALDEIIDILNKYNVSPLEAYGLFEIARDVVFWHTDKAETLVRVAALSGLGTVALIEGKLEGEHESKEDIEHGT